MRQLALPPNCVEKQGDYSEAEGGEQKPTLSLSIIFHILTVYEVEHQTILKHTKKGEVCRQCWWLCLSGWHKERPELHLKEFCWLVKCILCCLPHLQYSHRVFLFCFLRGKKPQTSEISDVRWKAK